MTQFSMKSCGGCSPFITASRKSSSGRSPSPNGARQIPAELVAVERLAANLDFDAEIGALLNQALPLARREGQRARVLADLQAREADFAAALRERKQ